MTVKPYNPYTCRTLIRLDKLIYLAKGKNVAWWQGHLVEVVDNSDGYCHGVAVKSHFPGWAFRLGSKIQNKFPWTQRIFSL